MLIDSINAALKEATSPEEAFPLVLHSQVDRVERQKVLDELSSKYRVFENNLNGVKYVFDYDIAKELFSHNESAIRYTCLITDSKSSKVKEIESYLNYFPVFSDLDSYKAVLPCAKKIQNAIEDRLSSVSIERIIEGELSKSLKSEVKVVDLLLKIKKANASVAISALGWENLISNERFIQWAEMVFSIFSGEIGKVISEKEVHSIYTIINTLKDPVFSSSCLGDCAEDIDLCVSIFMQWITGFMTPSVSWIAYSFLHFFDKNIYKQSGNFNSSACPYDRKSPQKLANSCLKNYMPFQAIHRLAIKDFNIDDQHFSDGDLICIIPDALFGSHKESEIVSSVIGAPTRPCMGMPTSTKLTKSYLAFFDKYSEYFDRYIIEYDFIPSLSALTFSKLEIRKPAK